MLRVLHIGKYFAPYHGGVERYMLDVMNAAPKAGITCAALVHHHERSWLRQETSLEVDGSSMPVWRSATMARALFTPLSPRFRHDMAELIESFNPDIIHVHLPNPSACWLLGLKAARNIPLVIHWHSDVITKNLGPAMRSAYVAYRRLERALLSKATAIIATSPSYLRTSQSLAEWPDKCHVIPLGLDARRVKKEGQQLSEARNGPFRVLAIGRLTYYKGFGFLLRALAQTESMHLHIVGQGELKRELQVLAERLGLGARVRFLGNVDDEALARELQACHCLCLPSIERTEAFGLVLLEAMVFARATVSSAVQGSGMNWVVEHGKTGIKVPPRDVEALASALGELQADPEKTQRLGLAGRQRFDEKFSIERSVDALRVVYETALKQAKA